MTLTQLKKRANEVFSSIIVFCPNFPPAAETNTAKKFEQLTDIIDATFQKVPSDEAKQRLRICLQEIHEARKHYDAGDRTKGMEVMQRAEEHFKSAFINKALKSRFVVGESGATFDEESGFPQ